MVRKPKFLIIDIIVNIILDYLKNTMHNLFTNAANKEGGVLSKKSSETFKQRPRKMPKKKFIFSKVACSKSEFINMCFSRFLL